MLLWCSLVTWDRPAGGRAEGADEKARVVYVKLPSLMLQSGAVCVWSGVTGIGTSPQQLPKFRLRFKNHSVTPDTLGAPLARLVFS